MMVRRIWPVIMLFLFMSGCAYLSPMTLSVNPPDPEHEIPLGYVSGTAVNGYFFLGIPNGENEGMRTAIIRAKQQAGADALVNVYVDRRVTYYPATILPLYTRIETIVYGTAVRYKDPSWNALKDYTTAGQPASKTSAKPHPAPASASYSEGVN